MVDNDPQLWQRRLQRAELAAMDLEDPLLWHLRLQNEERWAMHRHDGWLDQYLYRLMD